MPEIRLSKGFLAFILHEDIPRPAAAPPAKSDIFPIIPASLSRSRNNHSKTLSQHERTFFSVVSIRVSIQSDALHAFRSELLALVRDLRRLERESPFRFDIIGYPAPPQGISMLSRGDRRQAFEMLRDAHRNVSPGLYSPSVAGGGPIQARVEAVLPHLASMRQQAIEEVQRRTAPALKSRSQYSREYAIAHAIFSPAFIREWPT